ncbi:hypothetical protein ACC848_41340, partial [Rhizobium johnstonii]
GSIEVRTSAAGQTTTANANARTQDAPPPPSPRVWVTRGSLADAGCVNGCYRFVVNTQNFPGGNYTVACKYDGGNVSNNFYSYAIPS